ncbi:hypothetical protein BRADI_2g53510v3 [Brachypodium distachyon]|uniref:WRKY domain-containing protein n=1 Tax=Brachypodium distachyon TaxID=15368 RepID=A0A0Q3GGZ6_BRADI|nr:hypothetical protein BRADI_2g53510v3 [Brachypodium distachyon]
MQAQSRLMSSAASAADERYYEAVVRELRRGHELTAQLQAEAARALRGQGQAEATAAFILREVSRAFTVCISIMGGAAPATPLAEAATAPAGAARRPRDDGAPRKTIETSSPNSDGYMWRKYGQKRIMKTRFPRCSHHRERGCPATKQVQEQQHGDGADHPKTYLVIYVHEHTCRTTPPPSAEPEAPVVARGRLARDDDAVPLDGGRGAKEELERQVLVSSLACVLQGRHTDTTTWGGAPAPGAGSSSSSQLGRVSADDAGASASLNALLATAMPPLTSSLGAGEEEEELDVMDYDVPADTALCFGGPSYGMRDDDMLL